MASTGALAGVSCQTIDGVYTCTDGSGLSSYCQMVDGVMVCSDTSTGPTGNTCVTNNETGQQSCIDMSGGGSDSGGLGLGNWLGSVMNAPKPSPSSGWLSKLTWWFSYALNTFFRALVGFLKDLVGYVLGTVLSLVATAISAIGVPSWLSQYSLGNVLGQTGAVTLFFMGQLQLPIAFALIGAGYTFRLTRKFLTVFQW